ncbi:hypothetical protein Bca101_090372 [Brassica carinata]
MFFSSLSPSTPLFSPSPSIAFSFGGTTLRCLETLVTSCVASLKSSPLMVPPDHCCGEIADSRQFSYQGTHGADTIDLLKINKYGKDSVVWMDSDSNSDTDTDSEKDDENEFSKADPLALRLLERLLAFDPKDRASAEDALSDPHFNGLSNSEREPSTQPISKLEFDFERKKLTNDDVRELIYREILEYHPQMLEEYKHGGDQLSFMYPRWASVSVVSTKIAMNPKADRGLEDLCLCLFVFSDSKRKEL